MKTYTITSPSLLGLLSDDHLFFEGIERPLTLFAFKDENVITLKNIETLEKYLNDIYNLFLKKLSSFMNGENLEKEESLKIQGLLQEIIKVKILMNNVEKQADERTVD